MASMDAPSPRRVVVVSFLVDLIDVATNLVVALLTGSAVVFSEMAQGVADSVGSGLLVVGERRAWNQAVRNDRQTQRWGHFSSWLKGLTPRVWGD